jgi:hypothetical protein
MVVHVDAKKSGQPVTNLLTCFTVLTYVGQICSIGIIGSAAVPWI